MKLRLISAVVALASLCASQAATFINLTPKPKEMTVGTGSLALPQSFAVSATGLSDDMQAEIGKFISTFSTATGINVTTGGGADALLSVAADKSIPAEGYKLNITDQAVSIQVSAPAGLYYAFQSLMKIMPENVILGKFAAGPYSLPVVNIADEPRYPWRGMEIDVARHFFDVDQIKKMLDIMAVYKMNRLHWHLTDDQGWRFEMPKYPKLTTEAGAPKNQYWWDFDNHRSFLTNEMYGPYFYTVDEMKEIVAYAKERHIEVCPEVDMPGHMQCAIAAYPEFSTTPDSDHPVRFWPGVSSDILDISNPAVMQFLRDVIDQLAEIFPYEYIHIGGDECPTGAWANSPACQEFKKEYGLQSDRAIQNWMVKELAEHAKKDNRKLICWNEIITTTGADTKLAQDADILVYAWLNPGAANNPSKQAAALGLRSVWCSTSHYYLDYPQWNGPDEPKSMGFTINLERVYNVVPDYEEDKKELYYGVNCNLWTEFVCENKHLEYNALPRMIAVAETGWTPTAKKNFNDFKARFNADTKLLDLGNYTYGRHYVDNNSEAFQPEAGKYYRLITQASADANRRDRCIELVHDGCPLIADKSATAGKLWTNTQAAKGSADYDWQYWTFEADPAGSGKYAMINRKAPEGSVNPAMQGSSVGARWNYDNSTKHYNFVLGDYHSEAELGGVLSIRSDKGATWYLNCAQAAQNLAVNNWNAPDDGNGGMWLFHFEDYEPAEESGIAFTPLTSGKYALSNTLGRGLLAIDGSLVTVTDPRFGATGWEIIAGEYNSATNTQTLTLRNLATGLYIAGLSAEANSNIPFNDSWGVFSGNGGHNVILTANSAEAAAVTLSCAADGSNEYFLEVDGKRLFAMGPESTFTANGVNAYANAPAMQGSAWVITPVTAAIKVTVKEGNETVGTFYHYGLECRPDATNPLAIPFGLYEYVSQSAGTPDGDHTAIEVTAKKIKRTVTVTLRDARRGFDWEVYTDTIGINDPLPSVAPERPYLYHPYTEDAEPGVDAVVFMYNSDAIPGIKRLGNKVSTLAEGTTYAIEDTHSQRHAFRGDVGNYVGGVRDAEGASPAYLWTLDADGENFNVRNLASNRYIQKLTRSKTTPLAETKNPFKFTYTNGHWKITDTTSSLCWDGNEDLTLVGWDAPGHEIAIYTLAEAEPYFMIAVTERDQDGKRLSYKTFPVRAGSSYIFAASSRPGKALTSVEGNEDLNDIYENKHITVIYTVDQTGINEIATDCQPGVKGIYDLAGRRLSKVASPGVYIINGVKTIVK